MNYNCINSRRSYGVPQQGSRTKKRKGEVKLIEPRQANKLLASKKSLVNSRDLASRFFGDTAFNMKEFIIPTAVRRNGRALSKGML